MYAKTTIRLVIVPNEKVNPKITDEVIQTELARNYFFIELLVQHV